MTFSRRFPKDKPGSPYPAWEEISLTEKEEKEIEEKQRAANVQIMKECITDAKTIVEGIFSEHRDVTVIANALFDKRASHVVYWKEEEAKDRLDRTP